MKILWVRDGKIGHEKQVKVLLDEVAKSIEVSITEYVVQPFSTQRFLSCLFKKLPFIDNEFDIIIGAGHSTYSKILNFKKVSKKKALAIAVLVPSLFKNRFDLICAPSHDSYKIKNTSITLIPINYFISFPSYTTIKSSWVYCILGYWLKITGL